MEENNVLNTNGRMLTKMCQICLVQSQLELNYLGQEYNMWLSKYSS